MRIWLIITAVMLALTARGNDYLKALPALSTVVDGYVDPDSVTARMAESPLVPVEGMWQMLDGGATFALERHADLSLPMAAQPECFRLVMVRAPGRLLRPGTVIGYAVATADRGVYEARIYTDFAVENRLGVARTFTLHLAADGSVLTFKPRKSRVTVNLFRLLPYMYRNVVRLRDNRPDNLDGAVRIYPYVASPRFGPRYL